MDRDGPPFREDEIPAPKTVYGISKLAGEHLLRYAADRNGLSWNVVRFLFVYGPYQYAGQGYKSVILRNFERLLRGEAAIAYGDGGQILGYVFVDASGKVARMAGRIENERLKPIDLKLVE